MSYCRWSCDKLQSDVYAYGECMINSDKVLIENTYKREFIKKEALEMVHQFLSEYSAGEVVRLCEMRDLGLGDFKYNPPKIKDFIEWLGEDND